MLDASIANARGDERAAVASLRASIETAKRSNMTMHAAAALRRLGALLGGEQGAALIAEAHAAMAAEEIVAPARWAKMRLPGRWGRD